MLALTLLCASASSMMAATPAPTSDVAQLLAQLSDPDFMTRENATTQLMTCDDVSDDQLSTALRTSKSPEVRQRLVQIAMHRFYAQLQINAGPEVITLPDNGAALGVYFPEPRNENRFVVKAHQHPMLDTPAMLICFTYPGFPAYAYLRPGDLVTGMDGQTFTDDLTREEFSARIGRHEPGEFIDLDLIRNSHPMHVRFRLDNKKRLSAVSQMLANVSDPSLYQPWRQHLNALLGDSADEPAIRITMADAPESQPQPRNLSATGRVLMRANVRIEQQVVPGGIQVRIVPAQP